MYSNAALNVGACVCRVCWQKLKLCWQCGRSRRLHKKSIKDASQYSSRLSETSLYTKPDLGCISHVQPTLGGPRLIAWSQPRSHWQHRQHRRRRPILQVHSASPLPLGVARAAGATRRRRGGSTSRDEATRSRRRAVGATRRPHAIAATPQRKKDISDYVLRNGGEDARRINSCL